MLNTISWQQYFVAVLIVLLLYYSYVLLRYFRPEISQLIKGKKQNLPVVNPKPADVVMAAAKPDLGTGSIDPEDMLFAEAEPEYLEKTSSEELLSESLALVDAFKEEDNKAEFLELLSVLVHKYQPFRQEIDLKALIAKVRAKADKYLSFIINASEWPQSWEAI